MTRLARPNLGQVHEAGVFTPRIFTAFELAAAAHKKQVLKVSGLPYIVHPVEVMLLIAGTREDPDEDILCAAADHDAVEDAPAKFGAKSKIRRLLGARVLRYVMDVTKDPSIVDWKERKASQLDNLRHRACPEALVVAVADSSNIVSRNIGDYAIHGEGLWDYFGGDKDGQMQWFDGLQSVYEARIPDDPLTAIYGELVMRLRGLGGQEFREKAS